MALAAGGRRSRLLVVELHGIDDGVAAYAPRPAQRLAGGWLLPRFPAAVRGCLAGRVGPLANLESPAGCALRFLTDAPRCACHLAALRHHQPHPVAIDAEVAVGSAFQVVPSGDLRGRRGSVAVPFELPGGGWREVRLWLPVISRCLVRGISLPPGHRPRPPPPLRPTWLALGDSLTQGFIVASYTATWVHRVMARTGLVARNLGLAGLGIEPEVLAPALAAGAYDLATVGLGANDAWRPGGMTGLEERIDALLVLVLPLARRCCWLLPPWKPCEVGAGPPRYAGVPLDLATGRRLAAVRERIAAHLTRHHPAVAVVGDLLPPWPALLPDGVHPAAAGAARIAERVCAALAEPPPEPQRFP